MDKVVVVLAVDEGHEALLAGKGLVDEQILFIVAHRIAYIHCPPLSNRDVQTLHRMN